MSVNFCDIDSHTQQINHIDRLTRENAELRDQLQSLVYAASYPLHDDDYQWHSATAHRILADEINASKALLESI
jgi:hypothetical protein